MEFRGAGSNPGVPIVTVAGEQCLKNENLQRALAHVALADPQWLSMSRIWERLFGFPYRAGERGDQERASYSARNAITGSTRDALTPGTQLANTAVTPSTTMMAAHVTGSLGVRSNKNARARRRPRCGCRSRECARRDRE